MHDEMLLRRMESARKRLKKKRLGTKRKNDETMAKADNATWDSDDGDNGARQDAVALGDLTPLLLRPIVASATRSTVDVTRLYISSTWACDGSAGGPPSSDRKMALCCSSSLSVTS